MIKTLPVKHKASNHKMATRKKMTVDKGQRLKSLFNAKLWIMTFTLAITAAAIFSYKWIDTNVQPVSDVMPIRVVEIEGTLIHISREQIIEQLTRLPTDLQSSEYIGFFSSDLQLLEQRLELIPWLQKAELRRVWPDRLRIKIKENKAIARWNNNSLINEFGKIFTPDLLEGLEHLPLLTGPDSQLQQLLLTFKELQQLLVPIEMKLAVLNLNHRFSWSLELSNGIHLEIGRKNLIERVERFIVLYPLLKNESDLPIAKVDLRYDTGLAITRLETSELQASL